MLRVVWYYSGLDNYASELATVSQSDPIPRGQLPISDGEKTLLEFDRLPRSIISMDTVLGFLFCSGCSTGQAGTSPSRRTAVARGSGRFQLACFSSSFEVANANSSGQM